MEPSTKRTREEIPNMAKEMWVTVVRKLIFMTMHISTVAARLVMPRQQDIGR